MGLDTLINRLNGQVIDQDFINLLNRVFQSSFVGRDGTGAATSDQDLGTLTIPWGTIRAASLFLGGLPIDPGLVTAQLNRIVSGLTRAQSEAPDYLRPVPSGSFTLVGSLTNLVFNVNGVEATITTDITKSGLTLAPSTNNFCIFNDINGVSGQDITKFLGENDTVIPVDTMGSELTSRIGEFVALLNQTTGEVIYCKIESTTELILAKRGFFYADGSSPIKRDILTNNDFFQLLSLGFIFIDVDGVTIDVTFNNPVIGGKEPTSPTPVDGDYWLDITIDAWKIHTGGNFETINRTFAGYVCLDVFDTVGTRPEYFTKAYNSENTLTVNLDTVDIVESHQAEFLISIDGSLVLFDFSLFDWDASTDFESGVIRTVFRNYWLYISELGVPFISDQKPYDNRGFLKGWYHPYESWRAVAQVFNDVFNEFEVINDSDKTLISIDGIRFQTDRIIVSNGLDSDHDVKFAGNFWNFDDGTGRSPVKSPDFTKRLDAVFTEGNNGGLLDTGTIAALSTYHLFAIYNPASNKLDYLGSTSLTPTFPSGYTKKLRVASYLTDASANIRGLRQKDKHFYLDIPIRTFAVQSALAPRTNRLLTVPTGITVLTLVNFKLENFNGLLYGLVYNPNLPEPGLPSEPLHNLFTNNNTAEGSSFDGQIETDTAGQVVSKFNVNNPGGGGVFSGLTNGWIDHSLRK